MFKIIAAVAVATTVQTASAAKSNDLVFRDCVPAPGETADPDCESWPTTHTIKLANPAYNATDPDSTRFVQTNVALGPDRFKAAKCKSTTGFDYVGPSLIQQGVAVAVEDAEVEENEFQIFNTYGAGINYCRYTCQETQGCLYYTLANNRCNLKGEGTVLKQLKAGKTTQGGACTPRVPDADLPTVAPTPAPTPAPTGALTTCKAHSIYDADGDLVDVNIKMRKQCRAFKKNFPSTSGLPDLTCLFTKKLKRAGGSPGGCYDNTPQPSQTPAPKPANVVPTPSPKHCRKQCANKFDRVKRGKGKTSYANVCGLNNCKDCHECTVAPMVNFTVTVGATYNDGCPAGCFGANVTASGSLCHDLDATEEEVAAETNLCTPMYYKTTSNSERVLQDCPTGCGTLPLDTTNACVYHVSDSSGSLTQEEAAVWSEYGENLNTTEYYRRCTGPMSPKRVCFPTYYTSMDFTSRVISRITKKGFWERHCQDECYENEACGAYVYTRGTCKLYADLKIDQAQIDAYLANDHDIREMHNVKYLDDADGVWPGHSVSKSSKFGRDRRVPGVCGDPSIIRGSIAMNTTQNADLFGVPYN